MGCGDLVVGPVKRGSFVAKASWDGYELVCPAGDSLFVCEPQRKEYEAERGATVRMLDVLICRLSGPERMSCVWVVQFACEGSGCDAVGGRHPDDCSMRGAFEMVRLPDSG